MRAVCCPKCGAPVQARMPSCPYCGVGLMPEVEDLPEAEIKIGPAPAEPARSTTLAEIPPGWVVCQDAWHGFTLAYPPGWQVETAQGQISVREDPLGRVQALLYPYRLPFPFDAHQAAQDFLTLARAINPSYQAWQQGNTAPDSPRITLRTRQMRFGQPVEGCLNVLVNGLDAIISGYEAPAELIVQRSETLAKILTTFRPTEPMPRQPVREMQENSFTALIPAGWLLSAVVNHQGQTAMPFFSTGRDPQGHLSASMPWYSWTFTDSSMNMGAFGNFLGGMMGGPGFQVMPFMPATAFCQRFIAGWMAQGHPGLRVESITDRPDLAERSYGELAEAGYAPEMYEVYSAIIETTYTENGQRLREKAHITTQRQRPMAMMMGGAQMWSAALDTAYRAPEGEFAAWEPVLKGILDSIQLNPQWKAAQRARYQSIGNASERDRIRRLHEISQTLRETSDIVARSYWNQQAVYNHISEVRADAIRGVHNEVTPTGDVFKLPNGFDRYWMDGLGNFYGGSWMTEPDIHWIPLELGK